MRTAVLSTSSVLGGPSLPIWSRISCVITDCCSAMSLRLLADLRLVGHNHGAGAGEEPRRPVRDTHFNVRQLRRSLTAELAHALLQGEHTVHACVRVAQAAAVGVD